MQTVQRDGSHTLVTCHTPELTYDIKGGAGGCSLGGNGLVGLIRLAGLRFSRSGSNTGNGKSSYVSQLSEEYFLPPEKPYMVTHPESKARREGQSVSFCCQAVGDPVPDRYFW